MPPAGRRRQAAATTYVSTDGVIPQSALIQRAVRLFGLTVMLESCFMSVQLDDRLAAAEETRLRREQEQLAREQQRSNPPELATGTPYQWTAPPIPTWQANANNIPPSADESIYTREYQAVRLHCNSHYPLLMLSLGPTGFTNCIQRAWPAAESA